MVAIFGTVLRVPRPFLIFLVLVCSLWPAASIGCMIGCGGGLPLALAIAGLVIWARGRPGPVWFVLQYLASRALLARSRTRADSAPTVRALRNEM